MSKILFDMNNLAIRCVHTNDVKTVNKATKEIVDIDWDYWKLIIFTNIYSSLFKVKDVKTVVLAVDDRRSWRHNIWPRYKEDRKKKKDKDTFPWDTFFIKYNELIDEFRENLPFRILQYPEAEADDIIGTIALQTTDKTEVVSNDKDFLQLCSPTVKIYNPMKQQHVVHPDPKFFLVEQCFIGQSKDSIFNIKTPDDWPEGKRKPGFGPKSFEKVVEYGWKDWLIKEDLLNRFKRNIDLMDLNRIPQDMKDGIMAGYNDYEYPHPENIWKFIKSNNWPDMIDSFTKLENKLMQLY